MSGEVMVIRGLFSEIVDRMVALGGAIHPSEVRATTPFSAWITAGHDHLTPFDPETMKFVLDSMCVEAGVRILFHATLVDPIVSGRTIKGIRVLTRSGIERISAKVVIDATGDGDVAAKAGVPCDFGNPELGKVQPATLFFHINNVDTPRLVKDVEAHLHEFRKVNGVSYRALHWRVEEAEAAGEWDISRKSVNIYRGVREDEWAVNCTRIKDVDATDSESLTKAEIEGRRQVMELMNFFHKYVPGCENATIKSSASTVGIRESRHVRGEYLLTADDLIGAVVPEDSILVASNSVDVHGRNGANTTEYRTVEGGPWYGLPLRSLIPLDIENLIVAGRAISASSDAAGAVRVMPPCMAMGHAAGITAAISESFPCAMQLSMSIAARSPVTRMPNPSNRLAFFMISSNVQKSPGSLLWAFRPVTVFGTFVFLPSRSSYFHPQKPAWALSSCGNLSYIGFPPSLQI